MSMLSETEKNYLIEQMRMLQNIITRMNSNSFQLKGWMITIVAAFLALFCNSGEPVYIFIAASMPVFFWMLDSYYLVQERKYRGKYKIVEEVFNGKISRENFTFFDLSTNDIPFEERYCFFSAMFSKTEAGLYVSVIVVLLLAGYITMILC